jgi:hypothetical protein
VEPSSDKEQDRSFARIQMGSCLTKLSPERSPPRSRAQARLLRQFVGEPRSITSVPGRLVTTTCSISGAPSDRIAIGRLRVLSASSPGLTSGNAARRRDAWLNRCRASFASVSVTRGRRAV